MTVSMQIEHVGPASSAFPSSRKDASMSRSLEDESG